jgi:hypothetical protein
MYVNGFKYWTLKKDNTTCSNGISIIDNTYNISSGATIFPFAVKHDITFNPTTAPIIISNSNPWTFRATDEIDIKPGSFYFDAPNGTSLDLQITPCPN